jgi:flagellar biosynthesis/type III secretory pathway chaperone
VIDVDGDLQGLLTLLQQEVALCEELISVLEKERECLKSYKVENLLESNKGKETCLIKIKMVEESRKSLIQRLARAFHIPPQELTLPELISIAEKPISSQLQTYHIRLTELTTQIQGFNQRNKEFLQSSVDQVNVCLSLLSSLGASKKVYQATGEMARPDGNGRLFSRSV